MTETAVAILTGATRNRTMATVPPVGDSTTISNTRIVTSVCISVIIVAIVIAIACIAHRMRGRIPPSTAIQPPRSQEERQPNGIGTHLLGLLPVVTYSERQQPSDQNLAITFQDPVPDTNPPLMQCQPFANGARLSSIDRAAENLRVDKHHEENATNSPGIPTSSVQVPLESNESQTKKHSYLKSTLSGCSICTEDFLGSDEVRILPCDHIYHQHCIDLWLLDLANTCPLW